MVNGYEYSLIDAEELLDEDEDIKTLGDEEEEEETEPSDEDLTV